MIKAAAPYVRVMIRVPEAYLLLRRLETTRPGLLVMDADGRRIESISLWGCQKGTEDAASVAKKLTAALETAPAERWVIDMGDAKADDVTTLYRSLNSREKVDNIARKGGLLTIDAAKGEITPALLATLTGKANIKSFRILEPVPVKLTRKEDAEDAIDTDALAKLGGVLAVTKGDSPTVYMNALLLSSGSLAKAAPSATLDIETLKFDFSEISKGPRGCATAQAPLKIDGVLAVFPSIFKGKQTVVVRRGKVTPDQLIEAFKAAGGTAKSVKP